MTFHNWQKRVENLRAIPLESVLLLANVQRDRHDKHKWHTPKGVLSVTGSKFMNWSLGIGGGGAIDLAMHLHGATFKEAADWLAERFTHETSLQRPPSCTTSSLRLPDPDPSKLDCVREYLTVQRAIPSWAIEPIAPSGSLYADSHANAVFVMKDDENRPVGAELRGTTGRSWRGMAPGSRKDAGYFTFPNDLRAMTPDSQIILCESAIDAISCFALHSVQFCISTAGARPSPLWLRRLVEEGAAIYCGFDADATGDKMAGLMIERYPSIRRIRPSMHDWNDVLKYEAF